jgi:hypothetical protein
MPDAAIAAATSTTYSAGAIAGDRRRRWSQPSSINTQQQQQQQQQQQRSAVVIAAPAVGSPRGAALLARDSIRLALRRHNSASVSCSSNASMLSDTAAAATTTAVNTVPLVHTDAQQHSAVQQCAIAARTDAAMPSKHTVNTTAAATKGDGSLRDVSAVAASSSAADITPHSKRSKRQAFAVEQTPAALHDWHSCDRSGSHSSSAGSRSSDVDGSSAQQYNSMVTTSSSSSTAACTQRSDVTAGTDATAQLRHPGTVAFDGHNAVKTSGSNSSSDRYIDWGSPFRSVCSTLDTAE